MFGRLRILMDKLSLDENVVIAFNIVDKVRVGDVVGFTVGKKHFTIVKDTGYNAQVKLKALRRRGKDGK